MSNPIDTLVHDKLFAGTNQLPVTQKGTVLSGEAARTRGTVMGRITASGKLVIVDSDGTDDGRRTPYCVLAEDVDASLADKEVATYHTGEFNEDALIFGTGDTKETHRDAMRDLGMHMKKTQNVDGGA